MRLVRRSLASVRAIKIEINIKAREEKRRKK